MNAARGTDRRRYPIKALVPHKEGIAHLISSAALESRIESSGTGIQGTVRHGARKAAIMGEIDDARGRQDATGLGKITNAKCICRFLAVFSIFEAPLQCATPRRFKDG